MTDKELMAAAIRQAIMDRLAGITAERVKIKDNGAEREATTFTLAELRSMLKDAEDDVAAEAAAARGTFFRMI